MIFATTGQIVGGWEYVGWAYGITWAVLAGYGLSLWWRLRSRAEEAP